MRPFVAMVCCTTLLLALCEASICATSASEVRAAEAAAAEEWSKETCEATAAPTTNSAQVPHYCYGLWNNELSVVLACVKFPIDFNRFCNRFHPPLFLAASRLSEPAVEALLGAGADPHLTTVEGFTALHALISTRCKAQEAEACRRLIRRFTSLGIKLNRQNSYGQSPYWNAVWYAEPATVEFMLDLGADIDERGYLGKTPLDYAYETNSRDLAAMLERRGAKRGGAVYSIRKFVDRITSPPHMGH